MDVVVLCHFHPEGLIHVQFVVVHMYLCEVEVRHYLHGNRCSTYLTVQRLGQGNPYMLVPISPRREVKGSVPGLLGNLVDKLSDAFSFGLELDVLGETCV